MRADTSHPERDDAPQPFLAVEFVDSGVGIAPEDIKHIFDPFYTTKDAGRGTGLGLSVAYGIIEEHGGWFEVLSDVGAGTSFTVFLPTRRTTPTAGGTSA